MKKSFKVLLLVLFFLAFSAFLALYIGTHNIPVLEPKGMIGIEQRNLFYISSLLMFIVIIPVFILAFLFAWRYREDNKKAKYSPEWGHSHAAEIIWWGVPFVIIIILSIMSWKSSHALDPFKPIENGKKPLAIQVVALDWKWLFIYPEQGIATVNYIEFPKETPIEFEITADAPMNSFWIPQLGGQIYAMPSMRTKLSLIANETGTFRGSSANLSGEGFAGMSFTAKAVEPEEFSSWVESIRSSSPGLDLGEYKRLARPSKYDPASFYVLSKEDLFDWIVMKYMMPSK